LQFPVESFFEKAAVEESRQRISNRLVPQRCPQFQIGQGQRQLLGDGPADAASLRNRSRRQISGNQ
jgi:hypothetical protein